jgi:hypothetical protein
MLADRWKDDRIELQLSVVHTPGTARYHLGELNARDFGGVEEVE